MPIDPLKDREPELDLRRPGVAVFRWSTRYGEILIELFEDGRVAVNQALIEPAPHRPGGPPT